MSSLNLKLSNKVKINKGQLIIDLLNPFENIFSINKIDYIPYYLNNLKPGNRGGNSYVIKLISAQDYQEDEGYPEVPDLVMKVCKFSVGKYNEHKKSERFYREILALLDCNNHNLQNLVEIQNYGRVSIFNEGLTHSSEYRFYTMRYAETDMLSYITKNSLSLFDKVSLCLEICESLKQLWSRGYYHRDIKPENILFIDGNWTISDLGLVAHREDDSSVDEKDKWIGPRGWMSPEAMNRYLTESTPFEELFDCKIDHQSDIYQLGKVLWFILQGNSPEGGVRRVDFILRHDEIYQVIRTMINNSKKKRFVEINDVIICLKRIYEKMVRSGEELSFA